MSDIREVFRIVQEAIELGNDPVTWRLRMLERMNALIGAVWGISFLIPTAFDPKRLKPPLSVYTTPCGDQQLWQAYFQKADVANDPMTPAIQKLADRPVTRLRRELISDELWYASDHFKTIRAKLEIDDIIHAHDPLPRYGVMSVLGFTRRLGDKPFEPRHAQIVDLLRSELRHRWVERAEANTVPLDDMPPRLRQLISHLKGPMSEKQIAAYMGLSPHTTHNYVKEVYRRYKVSSRSELVHHHLVSAPIILPKIGYADV